MKVCFLNENNKVHRSLYSVSIKNLLGKNSWSDQCFGCKSRKKLQKLKYVLPAMRQATFEQI